jgi:hypothetical protein
MQHLVDLIRRGGGSVDEANRPCTSAKLVLYHATNREAAIAISHTQQMQPGMSGLFGPGIYFAETPEIARFKSQYDNGSVWAIVTAEVDLGVPLIVTGENQCIDLKILRMMGRDSVIGKRHARSALEFVVYESSRVEVKRIEIVMPERPAPQASPIPSGPLSTAAVFGANPGLANGIGGCAVY